MPGKKTDGVNVNLLRGKRKQDKHRQVVIARVQVIAGVVLAVYLVILLVVSGAKTALDLQSEKLADKIEDEKLELAQLRPVETLYNLVVNKYSLYDDAEESRIIADDKIEAMAELLPEGVEIKNLNFGGDKAVEVSFKAFSLYEAVEMLDAIEDQILDENYSIVSISRMSRRDSGDYDLDVIFGGSKEDSDG